MIIPNEAFIKQFKATPGAISVSECIAIFNLALESPEGVYADLGTHAGKAAMSAAQGLKKGVFYLVDPVFDLGNEEAWKHTVQGGADKMPWAHVHDKDFCKNIVENVAHNGLLPILLGDYSTNAIPKYGPYSWVFVDSDDHQEELVMEEMRLLEDRMVQGGIIAFHDYENQYQWPKRGHEYLISTGKYENIPIDWERIFVHVKSGNLEDGNNSWHQAGTEEFPKFVGAVKRK